MDPLSFETELPFTWSGQSIGEEITADSTPMVNATWAWGMDPEPVRMERGSDQSFNHGNRMGSVKKLTDDVATVVETMEHTAQGPPSAAVGSSSWG